MTEGKAERQITSTSRLRKWTWRYSTNEKEKHREVQTNSCREKETEGEASLEKLNYCRITVIEYAFSVVVNARHQFCQCKISAALSY
jgi:hypothetical protein